LCRAKAERYERPTSVSYSTGDPRSEFMHKLRAHIPAARNPRYRVDNPDLQALMENANAGFSFLPEVAFPAGAARGERSYYSLIHNRAFSNNAQLFQEEDRRLPEEDTLTVTRGFVGAYPNMFFQLTARELPGFANALQNLESAADYTAWSSATACAARPPGSGSSATTCTPTMLNPPPGTAAVASGSRQRGRGHRDVRRHCPATGAACT
jgi:hypothetical protein